MFITRDIAKDVHTAGKWIDVILADRYKNKHNRWDFKELTVELFPRHKTPVYPKDVSSEVTKYITWKMAHEDIAYLVVTQMGGLGVGKQETQQTQENAVKQAQDAVDAINERMQQAGQEP